MSRSTIVLKFGGSVLTDPDACRTAVHEVYRYRRSGHPVVAVCSAFKGETDEMLREAQELVENPHAEATAALLRTGELRSAACLAITCDAAGLKATLLDADQIQLRTEGPVLDAHPLSVNVSVIHSALERTGVVIIPGFSGRDGEGRVTLLGRGGSDLTALFLAKELRASCRLIKDVSGWYDTDRSPATSARLDASIQAPVFRSLSFEEAHTRSDPVVQPKAVAFASRNNTPFRLGRPGHARETVVDTIDSAHSDHAGTPKPLRVAVLGVGTVGAGAWRHLNRAASDFVVVGGLVRNGRTDRPGWIPSHLLTTDANALADHDLVVEALPDAASAYALIAAALRKGTPVVSANKDLIARHGAELASIASATGAELRYAAAVGGACPVLETAQEIARERDVVRVRAVLNATSNVVLDRIREGDSLHEAIAEAQRAGFAEADPSTDLNGQDAANKLVLLCHQLTGHWLDPDQIHTQPITEALKPNGCIRQVAEIILDSEPVSREVPQDVRVRLETVEPDDPLFDVGADWNAAIFETRDGETYTSYGRGAGRWPTAEAVFADAFEIRRSLFSDDIRHEAS